MLMNYSEIHCIFSFNKKNINKKIILKNKLHKIFIFSILLNKSNELYTIVYTEINIFDENFASMLLYYYKRVI